VTTRAGNANNVVKKHRVNGSNMKIPLYRAGRTTKAVCFSKN